jgi:hypothetical protein
MGHGRQAGRSREGWSSDSHIDGIAAGDGGDDVGELVGKIVTSRVRIQGPGDAVEVVREILGVDTIVAEIGAVLAGG